jgi:ferritin-like metal-binding protein YciE
MVQAQDGKAQLSSRTGELQTPMDLFIHELSDIRSAETIILSMLDEAERAATHRQLRMNLMEHLEQTQGHLENIETIFSSFDLEADPVECKGIRGMFEELQEVVGRRPAPEIMDSMIASGVAKTEHYEIVSYEGLVNQAKALGEHDAAKLLGRNLIDEKETLKKVEELQPKLQNRLTRMDTV